jgi:amidase
MNLMSELEDKPLWQWSACALAQAISGKRVSSVEVIEAHLDRIAAVNPAVNAVTLVLEDEALRMAKAADAKVAAGEDIGPLHGVPITIKENMDLVGSATTHGIVAMKDAFPESDAPVVAHLKAAGAIPIGRTNLPDFGLRWHTDNDLYGATRNPWDPSRTPGGSSGGEAAALAAGMSPLGVGGDMGGSLRYPAQCCGIAAIKPGLGRVSRTMTTLFSGPPLYYEQVASVVGPMARHVADLRLALDVMSQRDPGDPLWTPAPRLGANLAEPVRVAFIADPTGGEGSPAVAAAVRKAAELLAQAGYAVEEVDPPCLEVSTRVIEDITDFEFASYLPDMRAMVCDDARRYLGLLLGETEPDPAAYRAAIGERHRIARDWSLFMERTPLVLGPVSALEPFAAGADLAGKEELARFVRSIRLTEVCNLIGVPSLAVPVQVTGGLPQAVQIVARRFHEDLCFDAAEVIERAQGVFTPIEPRGGPQAPEC